MARQRKTFYPSLKLKVVRMIKERDPRLRLRAGEVPKRLYDLQEIGGTKSAEMVRRYAHLAPARIAEHATVVGEILRVTSQSQASRIEVEADVKKGATIARNSLI